MKTVTRFTSGSRELVHPHRAAVTKDAVSMDSVHCMLLGTQKPKLTMTRILTIVTVNFAFYFPVPLKSFTNHILFMRKKLSAFWKNRY